MGILDPERLRSVYETQGKTPASLRDAQDLAQQDARHVTDYCLLDDDSTKDFDLTLNGHGDSSTSSHYDDYNDTDYDESERDHSHHRNKNNKQTKKSSTTSSKVQEMLLIKPTMIFDVLGVNKI